MSEAGWPRHAIRIGLFEFRRTLRAVREDKARLGLMALGVLFPSTLFAGFAVLFADVIRGAGTVTLPTQARGTFAMLWLFAAFIVGQRVASARPRVDAEPLMLTTVSSRTVAVGLLLAETLRGFAYLALPGLTVAGAAVYLFGSVISLVVIPIVGFALVATAVVVGSLAGYAVAWTVATHPFVARHKTVLGGIGVVLFFGGYALLQFPQFGYDGQKLLAWLPIGWVADVAVVGTPVVGSGLRAAGAVGVSVLVLVVGGVLVERVTEALWFTDTVSTDDSARSIDILEGGRRRTRGDALAEAIRPFGVPSAIDGPTRRVAEWVVLRTRRDPRRLTFLLLPVFVVGSSLVNVGMQSGSLRALAAPLSAVVLPWLAGALFAMNPLGDEGSVLPVTLTAVPGTSYVRGLMAPGVLFGLPTVLVVTTVAGVVSPYSPVRVLALALVALYLTVVAVAITPAIGMALPRFSAIRVGQSRAVLPPRLTAVALHIALTAVPGSMLALLVVAPDLARTTLAGLVGYVPAFLLGLLGGSGFPSGAADSLQAVGDAVRATPLAQFRLVVGGVLLLGGVLAAVGFYRYAIARFESYSIS